jgi:hypothetical protein
MTAAEVQELVERRTGRLCLRLCRRWDGTVLTRDCPVGVARVRMRVAAAIATAAAFAAVLLFPMLTRLGSKNLARLEGLTFEERMQELRFKAYEWPIIGTVIEKVYPAPSVVLGGM